MLAFQKLICGQKVSSVPLKEPSWWYGDNNGIAERAFLPIASIYGYISQHRMLRPPRKTSSLPVICVGNFTAGGTGKTPLAIVLADMVRQAGGQPVFLSRGHGGDLKGPHLISLQTDNAQNAGDEPLLLANHATTVISRDRVLGAELIERDGLGSVIIMDDGLQNPGLYKNLAIVVVDGRRGIGNGRTVPAGPLRAPMEAQLSVADALVIYGKPSKDLKTMLTPLRQPIFNATVKPFGDLTWITVKPLLAFAGIGNPQRFYALLQKLGGQVVETRSFADHHPYTADDAKGLLGHAAHLGMQLVTTEKDFVRLAPQQSEAHQRLREATRVLPICTHFSDTDAATLQGLIDRLLD